MGDFKVGDIVFRSSYGNDIPFKIINIRDGEDGDKVYILKGLINRIEADSSANDLTKKDITQVIKNIQRDISKLESSITRTNNFKTLFFYNRRFARPGKILHIDSSKEYYDTCMSHYKRERIAATGAVVEESEQPYKIKKLLMQNRPDILIITGHDGLKKDSTDINSINNYRNSRYYIQSVKEARGYEADPNKLCIFAGACQSYYEAIMAEGANFASSPGRIMIHALDPAILAEKIALTDRESIVTPDEIAKITTSGRKGIWGIDTRGHLSNTSY